jgi:hypothetical protein
VSNVIPPHALSDLIGSIYDCALDPSRWDQTLRNIRDALDGHMAVVSLIDVQRRRPLLMKTAGLDPLHLPIYFIHMNELRDLIRRSLAMPMDDAHVASRDLPPGYMDTSPYFQACRKRGIVDMMQFILIREAPHFFSGFSITRHERQGVITRTRHDPARQPRRGADAAERRPHSQRQGNSAGEIFIRYVGTARGDGHRRTR